MFKRFLLFLVVPVVLAACAPTDQQRADYAAVEASAVSPAIYDKMVHGDDLSVSDVVALSQARVNDGIIIRYIRDHHTVYYLSSQDLDYLHHSPVSPSVVDYMAQTSQGPGPGGVLIYPPPPPIIGIGIGVGGRR
jgi:hypothetical protein